MINARNLTLFILIAIVMLAVWPTPSTNAQVDCSDYNVQMATTYGYRIGVNLSNLEADLRQAMECSEANATNDTINLDGLTVVIDDAPAAYDSRGHNGLPTISQPLVIYGGTIERDSALTTCVGGTGNRDEFRFFRVAPED